MEGTYVDLDAIDIKPSQVNDAGTIQLVTFESGREDYHLVTYAGAPFAMEFGAVTSGEGTVTHSGINLPQGASVDAETGDGQLDADCARDIYILCVRRSRELSDFEKDHDHGGFQPPGSHRPGSRPTMRKRRSMSALQRKRFWRRSRRRRP